MQRLLLQGRKADALKLLEKQIEEGEKEKDRKRLIALTKDTYDDIWSYDGKTFPEHVCGYVLGVFIELNIELREITLQYFKKGKKTEERTLKF